MVVAVTVAIMATAVSLRLVNNERYEYTIAYNGCAGIKLARV